MKSNVLILLCASLGLGCADEFSSFFEIEGHRIMALSASPPALTEDETATISAFLSDENASYQWSWCPLPNRTYDCAVTREELQAAADDAIGEGTVEIPDFDLGSEATAEFTYSIPSVFIAGICEALLSQELPDGVPAPECGGSFDIQIRLDTTVDDQTIAAVRDLELIFEEGIEPNQNPVLGGIAYIDPDTDQAIELSADEPTPMVRGVTYAMELTIDEASSETYPEVQPGDDTPIDVREELTVSWFREGGEFDKNRTGFIDGSVAFDILRSNEFTPPKRSDFEQQRMRIFLVIRDNRGGVDTFAREIELVDP